MNLFKAFLCLVALSGSQAFARDVNPNENLGQLTVTLPTFAGSVTFDHKAFELIFRIDNVATRVALDSVADVAAGTGCLEMSYRGIYKISKCGIQIGKKQLTTVTLAAVVLNWSKAPVRADFGPQPNFNFASSDASIKINCVLNPSNSNHVGLPIILPEMDLQVSFNHENTGVLANFVIPVAAGKLIQHEVQLADFRGTLFLDYIDGAAKYMRADARNYVLASYTNTIRSEPMSHVADDFSGRPVGFNALSNQFNYYKFAVNGVSAKVTGFPLRPDVKGVNYEVVINGHILPLYLVTGKEVRIPVATVDVHDYKNNISGRFKVFSDEKRGPGMLQEVYFPNPNAEQYLESRYFNTKTSLFFPIGFMYRFDFYLKDDVGRETLQDQVVLDLTKE